MYINLKEELLTYKRLMATSKMLFQNHNDPCISYIIFQF